MFDILTWLISDSVAVPFTFVALTSSALALVFSIKKGWTTAWFVALLVWLGMYGIASYTDYRGTEEIPEVFYWSFVPSFVVLIFVPWLWKLWERKYPESGFRFAVQIVFQVGGVILLAALAATVVAYNWKPILLSIFFISAGVLVLGWSSQLFLRITDFLGSLEKKWD